MKNWSKKELKSLKNLREKGYTVKEISAKLNRSSSSVHYKLSCLGVALTPQEVKNMKNFSTIQALCWSCAKSANSGCSWSKDLTPVEGWTVMTAKRADGGRMVTMTKVLSCPEFQAEI